MLTRLFRASLAGFGEFLNVLFPEPVSGYEPEERPGRWSDAMDPAEMVPDVPIFSGGMDDLEVQRFLREEAQLDEVYRRLREYEKQRSQDRRVGIRPPGPDTSDAGGVSPASPASPTRHGDGPW